MQARTRAPRIGWTAAVAAVAAAAQLACGTSDRQGGAADRPPGGRDASAAGSAAEDRRVNLTGCLERGAIPGSFVLTRVSTKGNDAGHPQDAPRA